jgi:hypothetical protein
MVMNGGSVNSETDRIILNYQTEKGEWIEDHIGLNHSVVSLRWNIVEIDLTPLSSLIGLKELNLGNNRIRSIDLTPLSKCVNLEVLILSNNRLENIDLSPLKSCSKLRRLSLVINRLQSIDLTPILSCDQLTIVGVDDDLIWKMVREITDDSMYSQYIEKFKIWNQPKWIEMWEFYRNAVTADKIVKRPQSLTPDEQRRARELFDWMEDFGLVLELMEREIGSKKKKTRKGVRSRTK